MPKTILYNKDMPDEEFVCLAAKTALLLDNQVDFIDKNEIVLGGYKQYYGQELSETKIQADEQSWFIDHNFADEKVVRAFATDFIQKFEEVKKEMPRKEIEEKSALLKEFYGKTNPFPFATVAIIAVNVVVFLLMLLNGGGFLENSTDFLISWGANMRMLALSGDWYRVGTAMFVHANLFHLLFNMVILFMFGASLEMKIGTARFLLTYIGIGIITELFSLVTRESAGVGASGAVFGIMAAALMLGVESKTSEEIKRKVFGLQTKKEILPKLVYALVYIGLTIGWGFLEDTKGEVGHDAHAIGAALGLLFASLQKIFLEKKKPAQEIGTFVMITVALLLAGYNVVKRLPNNYGEYVTRVKECDKLESEAMETYKEFYDAAGEERKAIYLKILSKWKRIKELNDSIKILPLNNDNILKSAKKMISYADLRVKELDLLYAIYEQSLPDTSVEVRQLEVVKEQIDSVLKE